MGPTIAMDRHRGAQRMGRRLRQVAADIRVDAVVPVQTRMLLAREGSYMQDFSSYMQDFSEL